LRFRLVEPLRYCADLARTWRQAPLRVLLLSDRANYTSEQQFAPLAERRGRIRERLGVVFQRALVSDALALPRLVRHYDVVGLKLGFRTPAAQALAIARAVRSALSPAARMIYFDGEDDLCVQWPELLPLVDLYVKKHAFRDRREYLKPRIGKTNLTDHVARHFGVSFADDIIPSTGPLDETQLGKIAVGWNVALDDPIRRLYARASAVAKDIDVVCRASVNPQSWIYPLRAPVIASLSSMKREYRVLTPQERVPHEVYYDEMRRSRVCVSPFGYGEICWRDFEAVVCGCVLVKPDMSHVETDPDIFVPEETYVPVRWDYADLVPALKALLADPARCERIRANALAALRAYLERGAVVERFAGIVCPARRARQTALRPVPLSPP
jgi:Glycosyl transferases group 1